MELTVIITVTDDPHVGVRTQAREMTEVQIRPTLLRAQQALQAEVDALEDCPFHNRAAIAKAENPASNSAGGSELKTPNPTTGLGTP